MSQTEHWNLWEQNYFFTSSKQVFTHRINSLLQSWSLVQTQLRLWQSFPTRVSELECLKGFHLRHSRDFTLAFPLAPHIQLLPLKAAPLPTGRSGNKPWICCPSTPQGHEAPCQECAARGARQRELRELSIPQKAPSTSCGRGPGAGAGSQPVNACGNHRETTAQNRFAIWDRPRNYFGSSRRE